MNVSLLEAAILVVLRRHPSLKVISQILERARFLERARSSRCVEAVVWTADYSASSYTSLPILRLRSTYIGKMGSLTFPALL